MYRRWLYFQHKLFRYRQVETQVANQHQRLLDIGCADGENMLYFKQPHLAKFGIEPSWPRLQEARGYQLKVAQASGTQLPYGDASFDFLYVAHVLHHVEEVEQLLNEIKRVLTADGEVFLIETVTDHPILKLGRKLYPYWRGDHVENDWSYAELAEILKKHGFTIRQTGRYNLLFWLWEMFPLTFGPFELFTPLFVYLDLLLEKWFGRYFVHCYFVLALSDT